MKKLKNAPKYFQDLDVMVNKINKLQKARKLKKREIDDNYEQFKKDKVMKEKESEPDNDLKMITHTRAASNQITKRHKGCNEPAFQTKVNRPLTTRQSISTKQEKPMTRSVAIREGVA
jgi:hypothetical protein